jgi:hypothetical protein
VVGAEEGVGDLDNDGSHSRDAAGVCQVQKIGAGQVENADDGFALAPVGHPAIAKGKNVG